MPSTIKKRTWCTTCQEFELFESHLTSHETIIIDSEGSEIKKTSKTTCDTCGNEYVPYSLSEVPEEKILEQRERYRQMKKTEFIKMLSAYQDMSRSNILADMMREVSDKPVGYTVREDDAGQEAIDTAERAARDAQRLANIEFKEQFRGAQRNDKCRCGSGNKYKKCCLPKVNAIR
jgi:hypothetical protein